MHHESSHPGHDPAEVARYGADIFREQLHKKPGLRARPGHRLDAPEPVPGVDRTATGAEEISFREVRSFNLDEYMGLAPEHPQSYRHFMNREFFDHIDIEARTIPTCPPGDAEDPFEACDEYERAIRHCGGIDIQLLGIGRNGHIGFNEPTSCLVAHAPG